ncbi:MAG: peptide deformylase [Firmicutes bacterium]|nr:peptide deformylase [Eubacterium sp.]MBR2559452.1 peptide deformylase [Bacillota bacterium]MBR3053255.1 peptide deformylase [Bacillota bacterium]MBR3212590.1 peptide deformylase [Bacillota bacterium]
MALRHVVVEGDEILRKKCREVGTVTDRTRMILSDMLETMLASNGVGIAAPQVGIMRRMFVAMPDPDQPEDIYYMIDPEIYEEEGSQTGEEGCLSVPGLVGTVERPERIRIRAKDLNGDMQDYEFTDFGARVMCHEYDHLNGILYTDKATDVHEPVYEDEDAEEETEEEE